MPTAEQQQLKCQSLSIHGLRSALQLSVSTNGREQGCFSFWKSRQRHRNLMFNSLQVCVSLLNVIQWCFSNSKMTVKYSVFCLKLELAIKRNGEPTIKRWLEEFILFGSTKARLREYDNCLWINCRIWKNNLSECYFGTKAHGHRI